MESRTAFGSGGWWKGVWDASLPPKKSVNEVPVEYICVVRSNRVYFKSKIFPDGPIHFNITIARYRNKEVGISNLKPGTFLRVPRVSSKHFATRMHSSRMRSARSSSRPGGSPSGTPLRNQAPPPRTRHHPPGTRHPPRTRHPLPVDSHTPVNILPCPKLRLRAVKMALQTKNASHPRNGGNMLALQKHDGQTSVVQKWETKNIFLHKFPLLQAKILTLALCRIASTCKSAASFNTFSKSGKICVSRTNVSSSPILLN